MNIRPIQETDNPALAAIIRTVMTEFHADPATTVLGDPSLDRMYAAYQEDRAAYHVALNGDRLIGGAGIRRLEGAAGNICELQRMFLLPEARGRGLGRQLMEMCLGDARSFQYEQVYLESLSQMTNAIALYRKFGFRTLNKPWGDTGHGGCNVWMALDLR